VITNQHADPGRIEALRRHGVEILQTEPSQSEKLEAMEIASLLAAKGVTRVLIEGGGTLAASFVKAGLVDEVVWFQSGKLIGADGIPALGPIEVHQVAQSPAYQRMRVEVIAEDTVTYYVRRAPPSGDT
jgi:diaminohydroxyphosphoribosylaminopyrimidine deaminase/5-amino-6-(5-phosphoribosylamino)uracil reductase